jgi:SAM-dependent methyltransferase
MLQKVSESTADCKCCGKEAVLFDVCDFAKNCREDRGVQLPLTGIPIYYFRCPSCGFVFTTQFDDLSDDDFKQQVYNEDYVKVDPDCTETRPAHEARLLEGAFGEFKQEISVLDFGGGQGQLARNLAAAGFGDVVNYDPFHEDQASRPQRTFNLVVCFEVVEHSPDPVRTFRDMFSFLDPQRGLVLFSTLLAPPEIGQVKASWWYIGPRNGHVSIHTQESLAGVICGLGMSYLPLSANMHWAYKTLPDFARAVFTKQSVPVPTPAQG